MNQENKPYIALFISVVSVSFAAILITLCEADALSKAFYRLFFTVILILPFVILQHKIRKEIKNLDPKSFLIMIGIGIILAAHFAFWITSLDFTSVSSSVILVTAHPILVGPVSHYFLKEKLSFFNTMGIMLSVFGVVVLVLGNNELGIQTIDTFEGNVLAILGGIMAGLYILGGRKLRKTVSVISYAFVVYSVAAAALLVICLYFKSELINIRPYDFQLLFLMALVSGILGHTLYNWSLEHIRASIASVALLGEPIGSSLLAFVIPQISQVPSVYTIIGGAIILVGIYLTAKNYQKKQLFSKT